MTPRVAVCICTYDRSDGLRSLLHAIDAQRLAMLSCNEILVVVVDNSAAVTAAPVFLEYSKVGRFPSLFVHEERKGLSNARNAAAQSALASGAAFFAFIDDDELPSPNWIETLLTVALKTGAGAVVGPVFPVFGEPPAAWATALGFYAKDLPSRNGFVEDGYTANCLFSSSAVNVHNLSFDPRFNETGGEDTWFFRCLLQAGERIAWAERASAMELVPKERMTPGWLLKRWYRTGAIEASLGKSGRSSRKGTIINLFKGLTRVGGGAILIVVASILRPFTRPGSVLARFYTLCRGAGLIMSMVGREYKEYSSANYRRAGD